MGGGAEMESLATAGYRTVEHVLQSETCLSFLRASLGVTTIQSLGGDAVVYALAARGGCASLTLSDVLALDAVAFSRLGVEVNIEELKACGFNQGTKGETVPWSNPCASGEVACAWSSVEDDSKEESFVSWPPDKPYNRIEDRPTSGWLEYKRNFQWVAVDLGPQRRRMVSHYALRGTVGWEGMGPAWVDAAHLGAARGGVHA